MYKMDLHCIDEPLSKARVDIKIRRYLTKNFDEKLFKLSSPLTYVVCGFFYSD